jgi:DNA repair protein RadD
MKFKPRYYQTDCIEVGIEVLKSGRKEVIVVPCGGGKSYIIAGISATIDDGNILVLQPSEELCTQNISKIEDFGVFPSVFSSALGRKELGKLVYATPKSLSFEILKDCNIKYVIIDECDFGTKADSVIVNLLNKLKIKSCLGLTATPTNLDQTLDGAVTRVLTQVKNPFFNSIAKVVQIKELVHNGFWSDIQYFNVYEESGEGILKLNSTGGDFTEQSLETFFDKMNLANKVSQFLSRLPEGEDALVFVPSIRNAEELQKLIPNSIIISSKTKKKDRKKLVEGFKDGTYSVCITVLAVAVGFDKVNLINILDCTPTNSFRLNMQKIGRITRVHKDKKFGRIIDFAGNFKRHGDIRDVEIEFIENYGWCIFGKDGKLLTDVPMDSEKVFTKDFLKKGGKPKVEYVFGEHNPGDAVITFGANKGKKVKELYYRKRHYLRWLANSDFDFKDKELERQVKLIYKKLA